MPVREPSSVACKRDSQCLARTTRVLSRTPGPRDDALLNVTHGDTIQREPCPLAPTCFADHRHAHLDREATRESTMAAAWREQAQVAIEHDGTPQRVFGEFAYQARSWRRARRVIAKAEHSAQGANPRFIPSAFPYRDTFVLVARRFASG
jgi:hypothetical protein